MILFPALFFSLCRTKIESFPVFMRSFLPPIVWPDYRIVRAGFPLKTGIIIALVISDFAMLLTFGVMCPPLAFIICLSVCVKIYVKEILIGRYIHFALNEIEICQDIVPIQVSRLVSTRIGRAIYISSAGNDEVHSPYETYVTNANSPFGTESVNEMKLGIIQEKNKPQSFHSEMFSAKSSSINASYMSSIHNLPINSINNPINNQ